MDRLLIAIGEAPSSIDDVPRGVRLLIEAADEILVVTPALPGRLDWLTSATDKAREQADERLDKVLGQLEEVAGDAAGDVGADDPLLALEDALREFPADHILIGLRGDDRSGWQEKNVLDDVFERFEVPLTVFTVAAAS